MGAGAPVSCSVADARTVESPSFRRSEGLVGVDSPFADRARPHPLAALLPVARFHGGRRRLHRLAGAPVRPRHRPGLCLSQLRRRRRRRGRDDRDLRPQGDCELRPGRHHGPHRQSHHRRKPEADVRQAAPAERRLLCRPPLLGIRGADHLRRRRGGAGPQPPDQRVGTRSLVPDRARRRDDLPGAVHVDDRHRGHAAGGVRRAQADQAGALHRAHPIRRRRRNPGGDAGDDPGLPHHQGVQSRSGDAGARLRERRTGRGRLEQARSGVEPRDAADGSTGRDRDRGRVPLCRVSRAGTQCRSRRVRVVHRRVPARL